MPTISRNWCGRARWKIKNETFNLLRNQGYPVEHDFGHGQQGLSNVLLTLNLLAFALHSACDLNLMGGVARNGDYSKVNSIRMDTDNNREILSIIRIAK